MSRRSSRSGGFSKAMTRVFVVVALGLVGIWARSQVWLPNPGAPLPGASRTRPATSPDAAIANRDLAYANETIVERVVDGDTLVITGGDRVRLIGVDTPETKHPTKPPQPFGKEAYEFTRRMTEGKQVQIKYDPRETKDRYGRTLAYIYVDGEFLNELLIREGLARALLNYPFSPEMKTVFRDAEASAKSARRGLWSLPQQPTDVTAQPTTRKAG